MVISSCTSCPRRPVVAALTQSRLYAEQLDLATPRQWQQLVPRRILQEVAAQHGGDQAGGKLTAPVHFWVLLVGVLSKGCSSLKDLIARTQQRFGKPLGWLRGDKPWVTPAALSQRNRDSRHVAEVVSGRVCPLQGRPTCGLQRRPPRLPAPGGRRVQHLPDL